MPLPGAGMGLVSDKPQGAVRVKKQQRLKREEHTYVKHDKSFSHWKVLVGPTDWKEHAAGRIPDRYRVNNLPSFYDGAGIYELGVTPPVWLPPQKTTGDAVVLKAQHVVVVYLGCADHVHHHLQRYGQTGAHLEGARSTRLFTAKNESSGASPSRSDLDEPRSFPSVTHSRTTSVGDGGYMSTSSNASALDVMDEKMSSSDLIGSCRNPRGPRLFSEVFALGCSVAFRWAATESKAAGEKAESDLIDVFDYAWKRGGNFRQRSPDILSKIVHAGTLNSSESSTCFGDYSFFRRTPPGITISARRPLDAPTHAPVTRSSSSSSRSNQPKMKASEFTKLDIPVERCSVIMPESGRPCSALPVKGGKRCLLHKKSTQKHLARVANMSPSQEAAKPADKPSGASSCFPYLQSPAPTTTADEPMKADPPKRHGSLSFTSWLRTSELRLARADQTSILTSTCEESLESSSPTCRSPTSRRLICGLRLDDGTVCPEAPRPERKRCAVHKGLRNVAPKSPNRSNIPVRAF